MSKQQNASLEFIELKKIKPISNRPIEEKSPEFLELLQSVKEQGVNQPVLLRKAPDNGHFELVAGGRRFKAAELAGLDLIPAYIKPLTDEEARIAQTTENVQRKDLTPLQESDMYQKLFDLKLTAKEVAEKVGKTQYYVSTQQNLQNLIKGFKDILSYGNITLQEAVQVARLSKKSQEVLWDAIRKDVVKCKPGERFRWNFENYMSQLQRKLSDAKFDIKSEVLVKEAGSCVACPKNSQNMGSLFKDELNEKAVCTDAACWNLKNQALFKSKLLAAIEKGVIIGKSKYGEDKNDAVAEKAGAKIETVNDWNERSRPQKPQKASWQSKKEFADEVKEWEKSVELWKKYIEEGKIFPVFMINGHNEGQTLYFSKSNINVESRGGKGEKKMAELPKAQQAERIKENLERRVEIKMNEFTQELYKHISDYRETMVDSKKPLNIIELLGLLKIVSHKSQKFKFSYKLAQANLVKKQKDFDELLNVAIREAILSEIHPSKECAPTKSPDGLLIHELGKNYFHADYEKIKAKYDAEIKKMTDRSKERVKALK